MDHWHGREALDGVLQAVRLRGAIFFDVQAGRPWAAAAPSAREVAARVMPDADHVMEFHAIRGRSCWAGLAGSEAFPVQDGDYLVFPQGDPHYIVSEPRLRATVDAASYIPSQGSRPFSIQVGAAAPETRITCGFLGCDSAIFNPLLAALPRVLHIPNGSGKENFRSLVNLVAAESGQARPGSATVLARLSEALFVEAALAYLESGSSEERGWFGALRDEIVGRALGALHAAPAAQWTLELLAERAGASRTVLAERFAAHLGIPPMQYLLRWRMQLAMSQLRSGNRSVGEVAAQVGYASEAAFSRAFKKASGLSPGALRRHGGLARPTPLDS